MINSHNVLALIPARGGSKGIPKKNIKPLMGKPLIEHSIELAKEVKYIDKIVVSTDCDEIAFISEKAGVQVIKRPDELAQDTSLVKDAIQYTVKELEKGGYKVEYILLLEATSPLRKISDVEEVVEKLDKEKYDSIATFSQSCISPGRLWKIENDKLSSYIEGSNPWLPRQKQPIAYEGNALAYGFTRESLKKYEKENSILVGNIGCVITNRAVKEIDDELDFMIVEKLMEKENENIK